MTLATNRLDRVIGHIESNQRAIGSEALNPVCLDQRHRDALAFMLRPGAVIILKERQTGVSTLLAGLCAWHASVGNDSTVLVRNNGSNRAMVSRLRANHALGVRR